MITHPLQISTEGGCVKHSLDCEFAVLELHNSCRRHKQRLLKQYKKGKMQPNVEKKKPKKQKMRKKAQLPLK
jgi:hypothetical protein